VIPAPRAAPPRIAVLADDLIWATRLADGVRAAEADVVAARTAPGLDALLPDVDLVIVDLTARAYDGVVAIAAAAAAGRPILAVAQHDDHDLRKRALQAGADRVYAYRKLFEDGPATLSAWIAKESPA
jgi:DNA-binding response OmpR family regulator